MVLVSGRPDHILRDLHGSASRFLQKFAGKGEIFEGLSAAGRRLQLSSKSKRRLRELDAVAAWLKHASDERCGIFLEDLAQELRLRHSLHLAPAVTSEVVSEAPDTATCTTAGRPGGEVVDEDGVERSPRDGTGGAQQSPEVRSAERSPQHPAQCTVGPPTPTKLRAELAAAAATEEKRSPGESSTPGTHPSSTAASEAQVAGTTSQHPLPAG